MDLSLFSEFIGSVAFPVIMTLLMLKALDKEREDHKEEMNKITEALNNNTQVLLMIKEHIGGDE